MVDLKYIDRRGRFSALVIRALVSVLLVSVVLSSFYIAEGGHTFIANVHVYDTFDSLHEPPAARLSPQPYSIPKQLYQSLPWPEQSRMVITDAYTLLFTPPPEVELS